MRESATITEFEKPVFCSAVKQVRHILVLFIALWVFLATHLSSGIQKTESDVVRGRA